MAPQEIRPERLGNNPKILSQKILKGKKMKYTEGFWAGPGFG
jgi:hypothetical protein